MTHKRGYNEKMKYKMYDRDKYSKAYGIKTIFKGCRNCGSCDYCRKGRMHKNKREEERMNDIYDYYEMEMK